MIEYDSEYEILIWTEFTYCTMILTLYHFNYEFNFEEL